MDDAALLADLLKAMDGACLKCWKAEHPPPASAPHLMDDYKRDFAYVLRREDDILSLAAECGYDGTMEDLRYAAHREAYARSGEDADLAKMLRHVTMATSDRALPHHGRPREALPRAPAHRTPVGSRGPLAAHRHHARPVQPRRRAAVIRGAARPWPAAARGKTR